MGNIGICKKCGTEATLINGICSICLALEVNELAKEDYKEDPCWTPGPIEAGLVNEDDIDDSTTLRFLEKTATTPQESSVKLQMGIRSSMKDRDGAIKNIMQNMGLFNSSDRVTYRDGIENMYDKYKKQIENGDYKIDRARKINGTGAKVIDTYRGVVVYQG